MMRICASIQPRRYTAVQILKFSSYIYATVSGFLLLNVIIQFLSPHHFKYDTEPYDYWWNLSVALYAAITYFLFFIICWIASLKLQKVILKVYLVKWMIEFIIHLILVFYNLPSKLPTYTWRNIDGYINHFLIMLLNIYFFITILNILLDSNFVFGHDIKDLGIEIIPENYAKLFVHPFSVHIDRETVLGRGNFSTVYRGKLSRKGETRNIAIKCVTKSRFSGMGSTATISNFVLFKSSLSDSFIGIHKQNIKIKLQISQDLFLNRVSLDPPPDALQTIEEEVKNLIRVGNYCGLIEFLGLLPLKEGLGNDKEIFLCILTEECRWGSLKNFIAAVSKDFSICKCNCDAFGTDQSCFKIEQVDDLGFYNELEKMNRKTFSTKDLFYFSLQIAEAMTYLADCKVLHGDLSLRNVLVCENYRAKVADFGLSHRLYDYQSYVVPSQSLQTNLVIPWAWMSIEVLSDLRYSEKSDLWSFGVVLWELYTLGRIPFQEHSWTSDFVEKLRNGYKLPTPCLAPSSICKVMDNCFQIEPSDRLPFRTVKDMLYKEMVSQFNTKLV